MSTKPGREYAYGGDMTNVSGGDTQERGSRSRPYQFGMRKSCDECGWKKKRCDGQQPCSRCLQSETQCRYSKRRWHRGAQHRHLQQRQLQHGDHDAVNAMEDLIHWTPAARLAHGLLPFKRCRLRASPATGLVGMRENAFISDFFGCFGFLPLTNESQIRETMVKIMSPAYPGQDLGVGTDSFAENEQSGAVAVGSILSGIDQLAKDPSFCTFWCAVALGALAKGSPIESVASYAELAGGALVASRSSSTDVELAKASAILAYLHTFTGDLAKFNEALELSEACLRTSTEQWSTDMNTGLPDLVLHCRWSRNVNDGSIASSWPQDYASPQLNDITSESELYQYIARSFRAFDTAILAKAEDRCAGTVKTIDDAGWHNLKHLQDNPSPGEVSEAVAAVLRAGDSPEFEPLQETAERPSIRTGIGGLLINGTLVFEKAAKGDLGATLEKLDRSVEVYERYPGLSRCMMESHMLHMLLTLLAEIDSSRARGMYERLRRANNSCRAPESVPIPPLEEWGGVAAICIDHNCRTIEALIKGEHMKIFNTTSVDPTEDSAGLAQTTSIRHGQTQNELLRASLTHRDVSALIPSSSTSSLAGSDAADTRTESEDPAGAVCRTDDVRTTPASSIHPSNHTQTGFDMGCSAGEPAIRAPDPFSSAEFDGRQEDTAQPEDGEIAEADWLEVAHVMLDAAHA